MRREGRMPAAALYAARGQDARSRPVCGERARLRDARLPPGSLDSGFRRNDGHDGKVICRAFIKGQAQGRREDDSPMPAPLSLPG